MSSHRVADERGSLPAALLAVVVVSGLVTTLMASTITGQRQTAFDETYERTLQSAEVGLDRAASLVISRAQDDDFAITEDVDGYDVETQAVRNLAGWQVTSTSIAPSGESRTVSAEITVPRLFEVAAFGRFLLDFNGNNGADSYRSGTFQLDGSFTPTAYGSYLDSSNELVPPNGKTGKGIVATNGELAMKGQAFEDSDGAQIHFAKEKVDDPLSGATGYCNKVPLVCNDTTGKLEYFREPIVMPDVDLPAEPTGHFDGADETLGPGTHVFTSAKLYSSTTFTGTPENPTILYLTGQLSVPNHQKINFETVGGIERPRPSPSLRIYSVSEGVAMSFATHVQISGLIYAPRGAFGGGSQGHIWGALVASGINNTGGWEFHYDEAAADVQDLGELALANWVER